MVIIGRIKNPRQPMTTQTHPLTHQEQYEKVRPYQSFLTKYLAFLDRQQKGGASFWVILLFHQHTTACHDDSQWRKSVWQIWH